MINNSKTFRTSAKVVCGLLVLLLASACDFNSNGDAEIAAKTGRVGNVKTVDGKPEGEDQKPSEDQTPIEVKNLLAVLTQAHQIHREIWFKLTDKRDDRGSGFKRIGSWINLHRVEKTWKDENVSECNAIKTRVVQTGSFEKNEAVTIDLMGNIGCGASEASYQKLATFTWEKLAAGARKLKMNFLRAELAGGFGLGLQGRALTGDKDANGNSIGREANCELTIDASSSQKIKTMVCEGMGQDISANSYIEMTSLQYSSEPFTHEGEIKEGDKIVVADKSSMVALVKAVQMTRDEKLVWNKDREFTMPIPEIGKITVVINLLAAPEGEAFDKAKEEAEAKLKAMQNDPTVEKIPVDFQIEDPNAQPGELQNGHEGQQQGRQQIDPQAQQVQQQVDPQDQQQQGQEQQQLDQQQNPDQSQNEVPGEQWQQDQQQQVDPNAAAMNQENSQQGQYQEQAQNQDQQPDQAQAGQEQVETTPEQDEMARHGFSMIPAHSPTRGTAEAAAPSFK